VRANKINIKNLRRSLDEKGEGSISELARRFGCSRQAIYFAMEMPRRYPRIYKKLQEVCS
jgi:hypothetical protein